jgi:pimeloyl-ACP methyl ester carboxylesterase
VAQRRLGVHEWGDPGGAPLLFLHGMPGSRLLQTTVDANDRLSVVTYDRPGYGLSTPTPGRTVAAVADDIAAVADALGWQRFAVAGVSAGGPHALAAAALLPDRVTRCAAIVTLAPFGAPGLDFYAGMDDQSRLGWRRTMQGGPALEQEYAETASWVDRGLPGLDLEESEKGDARRRLPGGAPSGRGWVPRGQPRAGERLGLFPAEVGVPTRIMQARDDTSTPAAHGEWLADHIPGAELIWVGGDHFGPRDDEEMQLLAWGAGAAN